MGPAETGPLTVEGRVVSRTNNNNNNNNHDRPIGGKIDRQRSTRCFGFVQSASMLTIARDKIDRPTGKNRRTSSRDRTRTSKAEKKKSTEGRDARGRQDALLHISGRMYLVRQKDHRQAPRPHLRQLQCDARLGHVRSRPSILRPPPTVLAPCGSPRFERRVWSGLGTIWTPHGGLLTSFPSRLGAPGRRCGRATSRCRASAKTTPSISDRRKLHQDRQDPPHLRHISDQKKSSPSAHRYISWRCCCLSSPFRR